jgi:hypothetical protein
MRMFRLANGRLLLLCRLFRFRLPNATASFPGSASFGVPSLESLAAWVVRTLAMLVGHTGNMCTVGGHFQIGLAQ